METKDIRVIHGELMVATQKTNGCEGKGKMLNMPMRHDKRDKVSKPPEGPVEPVEGPQGTPA